MLPGRATEVALTVAVTVMTACKVTDPPPITEQWSDDFAREVVGPSYFDTSDHVYYVLNGALATKGAHNHPLWLRKKLPRDVQIDLDCWSNTSEGDIKVEVFGDGHSYGPSEGRYTATSYVFIFGGWHNVESKITRLDEHGQDEVSRRAPNVVPLQHYHWTITRKGNAVDWQIDHQPFLHYDDKQPLEGPGHEYFAFNNWESDSWFDNVVITPL